MRGAEATPGTIVRMARTPTRTRTVLLAITLAMLAVVLAAWGVSFWKPGSVRYTSGTVDSPPDPVNGPLPTVIDGWAIMVGNDYGSLEPGFYAFDFRRFVQPWDPMLRRLPGWSVLGGYGHADWPWWVELDQAPRVKLFWPDKCEVSMLGFDLDWVRTSVASTYGVTLPHWFVSVVLAAIALRLWIPHRRSARRRALGLCSRCGYDRKGLAPAAACPECGETPATVPPSA